MPNVYDLKLEYFGMDPERGFLPVKDPLVSLPTEFGYLDSFGLQLPGLIKQGMVNKVAKKLPIPSRKELASLDEQTMQLAWVRYGFIQSACVHSQRTGAPISICKNIALPMYALSRFLNKPPILSYDAYVLNNWKRKDPNGPIKVDNLKLIQTFIEDFDQAWFILIHVDIEYEAATAIRNLAEAVLSANSNRMFDDDAEDVFERALFNIFKALRNMIATMERMPEGASPGKYYKIRPWIMSFEKVIYEGVQEYAGLPQSFRGQTGAQTSIFQLLEAGLQMPPMESNELAGYLKEMRLYMPLGHRKLIMEIEGISEVRNFIKLRAPYLAEIYNKCVDGICDFLEMHFEYAITYIRRKTSNPKGTGGTDFMTYLKSRLNERRAGAYLRN